MEIQQTFDLPFPPDAVWRCFHDTEAIVACLPGAGLSGPAVDGRLPLTMTVKLGPIVAAFAGEGEIRLDDDCRSGTVSGTGADRKSGSRVKGEAAFALHDATGDDGGPATRVEVRVDYAIAGSLAQFSRGGIVRELAAQLTEAFADNLKRTLAQAVTPLAEPAEQTKPAREVSPVAAATPQATSHAIAETTRPPLDLGAMFWPTLWRRLRQMLRQMLRLQPRR